MVALGSNCAVAEQYLSIDNWINSFSAAVCAKEDEIEMSKMLNKNTSFFMCFIVLI